MNLELLLFLVLSIMLGWLVWLRSQDSAVYYSDKRPVRLVLAAFIVAGIIAAAAQWMALAAIIMLVAGGLTEASKRTYRPIAMTESLLLTLLTLSLLTSAVIFYDGNFIERCVFYLPAFWFFPRAMVAKFRLLKELWLGSE